MPLASMRIGAYGRLIDAGSAHIDAGMGHGLD
jgi:hypothetical protein